jgi:amino acid transporter
MTDRVYGAAVAKYLMPLLIALVAFGGVNGLIMVSTGLIKQASIEKDFPAFLSTLHSRFKTPYGSLVLIALVASAYALIGDFTFLITAYSLTVWIVYGLGALGLLLLRRKGPLGAGFKNPIFIPAVFLLIACSLVTVPFLGQQLIPAFASLSFLVLGSIVYFTKKEIIRRQNRRNEKTNADKLDDSEKVEMIEITRKIDTL